MAKMGRPKRSKDIHCTCEFCGKEWTVPEWQTTGRKFCSTEHAYASRRGEFFNKPVTPEEKTCKNCGDSFLVGGAGNARPWQKYCSKQCARDGSNRHPYPKPLSSIDAAWLAGVFDGEGCLFFPVERPNRNVRMMVYNTHLPLLERIEKLTATGRITTKEYENHWKTSYVWQINGVNAIAVLKQILPWLIVKKEKALVAIQSAEEKESA